jgi:hypothetical protein
MLLGMYITKLHRSFSHKYPGETGLFLFQRDEASTGFSWASRKKRRIEIKRETPSIILRKRPIEWFLCNYAGE